MGTKRGWLSLLTVLGVASIIAGCGSDGGSDGGQDPTNTGDVKPNGGGDNASDVPDLPASALNERPWEVVSRKGESYLTNVFYADPSENEQIMPWAIDDTHVQIDRLIYPTIGNPNLYVKSDNEDEVVLVLRIEDNAYDHLLPSRAPEGNGSPLSAVTLKQDDDNAINFFLVAKSARSAAESPSAQQEGAGIYKIKPTKILQNPEPADMPQRLKARKTLRFVFDKAAMQGVPAGLYDTRFEVTKAGKVFANVFEYQYNAVRVFDSMDDEYTAINVTDTQVATGAEYTNLTAAKLDDFVDGVNAEQSPDVRKAAFITFNGDLHNGGSPGSIRQRIVAKTYATEAKRILNALKRLDMPIFLTAGNHDGYAATGQVPGLIKTVDAKVGDSLQKVIDEQNAKPWPDYSWNAYNDFLTKTASTPGGLHRDIYAGAFKRSVGETFSASFAEVPRSDRNMVLYDGFYQWQKTYGPLTASWTFGKNRYVSMNSFELRQHRRTGWGMYTVNYGGNISKPQLEWLDRELLRGKNASQDVVVLMHHDPRGGHKGLDYGYYSPTLEYRDIAQSTLNYLLNDKLVPLVCKQPDFSLSIDERESCLHDGLQEWMAPDEELDKDGNAYYMSGIDLLKRFVKSPHARTLVLGHVHFNSLEVLQSGDVLVPNRLSMDAPAQRATATIEAANPVRRVSWEDRLAPPSAAPAAWRAIQTDARPDAMLDPANIALAANTHDIKTSLDRDSFVSWRSDLAAMLHNATPNTKSTLIAGTEDGGSRELAVLRFTSGADLTSQTYEKKEMFGWSVMHVTKQTDVPRVNRVTYFIHNPSTKTFSKVTTIDVDRTKSTPMRGATNPVDVLFDW